MSLLSSGLYPFDNIVRLQGARARPLERPFFGGGATPSGRGVFPALNAFEAENGGAFKGR